MILFRPGGIGSFWAGRRRTHAAARAAPRRPPRGAPRPPRARRRHERHPRRCSPPAGLGKRFGAVVAAEDLNIEVPAGQRLSVIGSNGAGKTTFVNMVTGYLKPDAGQITLEGQDITRLGHTRIARLGICRSFQIPQLCLELTVLENLLLAVTAAGASPVAVGAGRRRRAATRGRWS